MWSLLWIFKQLDVVIDRHSSVKGCASDLLQVLCEPIELLLDLVSELSGVTQNESGRWLGLILVDLVED